MQDYDVTLKLLLQRSATLTLRELTGTVMARWLDVELPKVQNLRLDLLGETVEGGLVHLELQSTNDSLMPARMAEYGLGVFRLLGRFPQQIVLYVGEAPLRMESELRGVDVLFRYRLIDIRTLDGEHLLESEAVSDNVIAILARLRDHRRAVRRIVERVADLPAAERDAALAQLFILAGLRRWAPIVTQEVGKMPIYIDLMENEALAPFLIKKFQEGRQEGLQQGLQEGLQEGELTILRRQIEKRFGTLPSWASEKLSALQRPELEDLSERVLDAQSLDELLK